MAAEHGFARRRTGTGARPMVAAGHCSTTVLQALLRDQPMSPGKVSLAWSAAVGRAVARAAHAALDADGVLSVTAADPHWARELHRSRPLIEARLKQLLGDGVVKRIDIASRTAPEERRSHARVGHRQRRASAHR